MTVGGDRMLNHMDDLRNSLTYTNILDSYFGISEMSRKKNRNISTENDLRKISVKRINEISPKYLLLPTEKVDGFCVLFFIGTPLSGDFVAGIKYGINIVYVHSSA